MMHNEHIYAAVNFYCWADSPIDIQYEFWAVKIK